jgi:hypothetical protein
MMRKKEPGMGKQQNVDIPEAAALESPRKTLFERVAGYLDANDWHYHVVPKKSYFDMRVGIKHASARVILEADEMERGSPLCMAPE